MWWSPSEQLRDREKSGLGPPAADYKVASLWSTFQTIHETLSRHEPSVSLQLQDRCPHTADPNCSEISLLSCSSMLMLGRYMGCQSKCFWLEQAVIYILCLTKIFMHNNLPAADRPTGRLLREPLTVVCLVRVCVCCWWEGGRGLQAGSTLHPGHKDLE